MDRVDFKKYFMDHAEGLRGLMRIPSVFDANTQCAEYPYGKPSYDALMYMKKHLEDAGFAVAVYDNKVISASTGTGKRIDIASHLDVVEPGDGWDFDPFCGIIDECMIYGRGSQDMKVSAWLVFLAIKKLREEGYPFGKEIRLVYGSDEERTMEDMRTYVKHAGLPEFAMTPDGYFPMAVGEKGALMWIIRAKYRGVVKSLEAGVQPNVIAPSAKALIDSQDEQMIRDYMISREMKGSVTKTPEGIWAEITGKSAHASRPELGHNAASDLVKLIADLWHEKLFEELSKAFGDPYGISGGYDYDIAPMGKLTSNFGILKLQNGEITGYVDARYPYGVTSDVLTKKLEKVLSSFEVSLPYDDPATYTDPSDPYVKACLDAYREVSGDDSGPLISGGVSYSKVFGHCVSMGPVFPYEENLCHQRNEMYSADNAVKALEIYYKAIKNLLEVSE